MSLASMNIRNDTVVCYYRARYYDSCNGRFLSEDPIQFWGGINFYRYAENQPANQRDPSGELPVYGWWCGPNWTGGKFEMYNPAHAASYKKPINATDDVCKQHDICYYECRKVNPCDRGARTACMRRCDGVLIANMPHNWAGPLIGFGIDVGNDPPDAGEDDTSCSCQSDQARRNFNLEDAMRRLGSLR